jgi:hypothetical protein
VVAEPDELISPGGYGSVNTYSRPEMLSGACWLALPM